MAQPPSLVQRDGDDLLVTARHVRAGRLLVHLDERTWVKAGVEHSDGVLQLVDGPRAVAGGR